MGGAVLIANRKSDNTRVGYDPLSGRLTGSEHCSTFLASAQVARVSSLGLQDATVNFEEHKTRRLERDDSLLSMSYPPST